MEELTMFKLSSSKKTLSSIALFLGMGLATSAQAMTYSYNIDNPNGSDRAGDITSLSTRYDSNTNILIWSSTINKKGKSLANGFTLVLSNGADPKSHANEYAVFYGDFKTGNLTSYVYDGNRSSKNQWKGEFIQSFAGVINTERTSRRELSFDFSIDVASINSYIPKSGKKKVNDWDGALFDDQVGIWYHPFVSKKIKYNNDGSIAKFKRGKTSYYDTAHKATEVPEPGILALTGLGMIGMIGMVGARSRRKDQQI
jgi:hypothetical protein